MAIASSIRNLKIFLSERSNERPIYMTSGGFDPIHVGHVRCILETSMLATNSGLHPSKMKGLVVIVVNADSFLIRKKGYAFMPLNQKLLTPFKGLIMLFHGKHLVIRRYVVSSRN